MTASIQWNDNSEWPYEGQLILILYGVFRCQGRYSNSLVHIDDGDEWFYLADCDGWAAVEKDNED